MVYVFLIGSVIEQFCKLSFQNAMTHKINLECHLYPVEKYWKEIGGGGVATSRTINIASVLPLCLVCIFV